MYDALNRLAGITQVGTGVIAKQVEFGYNAAGQLTNIARFRDSAGTLLAAESRYGYDPAGRLTSLSHLGAGGSTVVQYAWTFDAADRIIQRTSSNGTSHYQYDDTNQLLAADHSAQADESYVYDLNGNRASARYSTGANNQLRSDGEYNYEYDAEGNRSRRVNIATGQSTEYTWDYRNRLTRVAEFSGSGENKMAAEYTYDVFDRRIAKKVDDSLADTVDAALESFIYDGEDVILEFMDADGSGAGAPVLANRYLHGPGVDQVLADEAAGELHWQLADNLGSITAILDAPGVMVASASYSSFGEATGTIGELGRYGFTGRERDAESEMYYARSRYLDPRDGAFINQDPLGFGGGDSNLQRYVSNSPTNRIDPWGLRDDPYWMNVATAGSNEMGKLSDNGYRGDPIPNQQATSPRGANSSFNSAEQDKKQFETALASTQKSLEHLWKDRPIAKQIPGGIGMLIDAIKVASNVAKVQQAKTCSEYVDAFAAAVKDSFVGTIAGLAGAAAARAAAVPAVELGAPTGPGDFIIAPCLIGVGFAVGHGLGGSAAESIWDSQVDATVRKIAKDRWNHLHPNSQCPVTGTSPIVAPIKMPHSPPGNTRPDSPTYVNGLPDQYSASGPTTSDYTGPP